MCQKNIKLRGSIIRNKSKFPAMLSKNNRLDGRAGQIIFSFIMTGCILVNLISCKKKSEVPSLVTINVTDITSSTASSGGLVFSTGGAPVTTRGICISTTSNPAIGDAVTNDGTGTGSFTSSLTGLTPGTTYYLRAYATNSIGTGYGNEYTITTPGTLPVVTTSPVSAVASTSAACGGEVLSDGGSAVTGRGVCWSISPGPTTADSFTADGPGTGIFPSSLSGLTQGTTYYVRAYATNSIGTAYGNEVSFTTDCNLPAAPAAIMGSTDVVPYASGIVYSVQAVSGASVYTWTVPPGATIVSGQGATSVVVNFGSAGGSITVRSENVCGVSPAISLTIIVAIQDCGIVTDIEGNAYNTVRIGTQCWFSENLKTTRYRNGDPIHTETSGLVWSTLTVGSYCWYNNDETAYKDLYGALYNWYAVVDSRGLCPTGWHVPSNGEWNILENYLINNGYNYDESISGNKISKSMASVSGWNYYPTEGSPGNPDYPTVKNRSGFSALPGGVNDANEQMFGSVGNFAIWWSSTEETPSTAWDRGVDYRYIELGRRHVNKSSGFSVRCIKD